MASIHTIIVDGEEYRAYFDPLLLKTPTGDSLLKTYVTPAIIKESSEYVEALALSFGVKASQIAIPTPYKISIITFISGLQLGTPTKKCHF